MMQVQPISIAGSDALATTTPLTAPAAATESAATQAAATRTAAPGFSFTDLFTNGMAQVEGKVQHADEMVRRFALDDSVPVHQVTIAIEEARMAVDMALQVRSRLVEAYRELMNTQL